MIWLLKSPINQKSINHISNLMIILKVTRKMLWVLSHSVFLAFSKTYVKHDLRKNKIVVASTTLFLGISTKFKALAPKLKH
jgi:hypothetical protein